MRLHILILFAICLVCPTLRIFPQVTDSIKGYTNQCQSLEEQEFIIGADVTLLQHIEDNGGVFRVNRLEKDGLQILKDHWFEYIRLTLWHTTEDEYKSLENVLEMTKRIQTMGLKLLLNIFYSDTWANPGQQIKPEAWQNLPFEVLKDSVYQYSRYVITAFKKQNTLPDMIQIGNEITPGMLWDDGRVSGEFNTSTQWQNFAALLNEGIRGVKDCLDPGESTRIMIHIDSGGFKETSVWFFDSLFAQGVDFDIIGLSFYSYWGGRMDGMEDNVNTLAQRYDKDIIIVEISYPWTLEEYDLIPNWMTDPNRLDPGYPASVEGQKAFLEDAITILRNIPNERGKGIFYWQPIDISPPLTGSGSENIALFDFHGVLLPSIDAFAPPGLARVTLSLNAASLPDTVSPDAFFELRGAVDDAAPTTLPDGNIIDWDESSTIELVPKGGDYFEASFVVPIGSEVKFKFWSQDAERLGLNGGWEIGNSDGDEDGNTVLTAITNTALPFHFFNCRGEKKPFNWRFWEPKEDSIAVWFRVFMNTLEGVNDGYNPNSENQIIGVRGYNLNGFGPLDWDYTKVALQREGEDQSVASYHLFSGVAYYPLFPFRYSQDYKFFIEPNGWEEGNLTGNRVFLIPSQDTTLHWVYYGDTAPGALHEVTVTYTCDLRPAICFL